MMTDLEPTADLQDLMSRSLAELHVPTERLHAGAVRRGRQVRLRRRLAGACGAAALAAGVVAAALPLLGASDGAEGTVAIEPAPTPTGHADVVHHPGWWDMPVGAMRTRLAALLPPDVDITDYERRNTEHGPGESAAWSGVFSGRLRDADDVGPGSVELMFSELPSDARTLAELRAQQLSCDLKDWDLDTATDVACETSELAAGLPQQRTVTFVSDGVRYREVRRWTAGGSIYAAVSSSVERKWGPPASASDAPLTLADLVAIATSPAWTTWHPAG